MNHFRNNYYHYVAGFVALVFTAWLHCFLISDLVVARVRDTTRLVDYKGDTIGIERARHGAVFVNVTTPTPNPGHLQVTGEPKQLVSYARGWKAIGEWYPLALVCVLVGNIPGFILGKRFATDEYKEAADQRMLFADLKTDLAQKQYEEGCAMVEIGNVKVREAEDNSRLLQKMKKEKEKADETIEDMGRKMARKEEVWQAAEKQLKAQLLKYKEKSKKKSVDTGEDDEI